jgi:hypothetical protein
VLETRSPAGGVVFAREPRSLLRLTLFCSKADLAVAALKLAIARGKIQPGLVHHSDRGSQAFLDRVYRFAHGTLLLDQHEPIWKSFRQRKSGRFFKTLKMRFIAPNMATSRTLTVKLESC